METLKEIATAFLHLVGDAALPFLGGLLLGSAIEQFLPQRWADRWLARGNQSLSLAIAAGAVLPGCAMSAVPLARSLKARGAPRGTVAAFLLIAPLISPHTVALTAILIGTDFAVARVILPVLFTLAFGLVVNRSLPWSTPSAEPDLASAAAPEDACHSGCCGHKTTTAPTGWRGFAQVTWQNARDLLPLFAISLAVVAVLMAFISPADLASVGDGIWAYAVALVGGIPLYVCDGGEVVLTRSLLELGLGAGPAFTFLLASVGTCLPTITMALGIIGRRTTVLYVAGTLLLALGSGLLVSAMR